MCLESPRRQKFKIPYLKKTLFLGRWGGAPKKSSETPSPSAARAQRRLRARNKAQGDDLGASWSRCTKNRDQRGAAAAPEGRTWPLTAPTCSTHGTLALLHALLFEPGDTTVRERWFRELPQATLSAAEPIIRVKEEQQPQQSGASGLRRLQPPAAHLAFQRKAL